MCRFLPKVEQAHIGGGSPERRSAFSVSAAAQARRKRRKRPPMSGVDPTLRLLGWSETHRHDFRSDGEALRRRKKLGATGNDVTEPRQNRVPVVSTRGAWQISEMRGEIEGWAATLETAAAAACPHKLEKTAVCACADGTARPPSYLDAARTARAGERFGQRGNDDRKHGIWGGSAVIFVIQACRWLI